MRKGGRRICGFGNHLDCLKIFAGLCAFLIENFKIPRQLAAYSGEDNSCLAVQEIPRFCGGTRFISVFTGNCLQILP
jgi:hypothetical protein